MEELSTYRPWLYSSQNSLGHQPGNLGECILEFDEPTDVPHVFANQPLVGGDFRAAAESMTKRGQQLPAPILSDSSTCFTPNLQNMRRSGIKAGGFWAESSSNMKSNDQKSTQFESLFGFQALEHEGRTTEFASSASDAQQQEMHLTQMSSSANMEILDQEASTSIAPNF